MQNAEREGRLGHEDNRLCAPRHSPLFGVAKDNSRAGPGKATVAQRDIGWGELPRSRALPEHEAEFIAKLGDCHKELAESEYWLELLRAEKVLPPKRMEPLAEETRELIAIFVTSLKTARSR